MRARVLQHLVMLFSFVWNHVNLVMAVASGSLERERPCSQKAPKLRNVSLVYVAVNTSGRITLGVNASIGFAGYRCSFGTAHAPNGSYYAYGYQTNFAPSVGTFGSVTLPL